MTAPELIREVEKRGGKFELRFEAAEVRMRFELEKTPPKWLLPALEHEKAHVADLLLRRYFLEKWQPVPGGRVQ
jgi:hypothetical protein